jgi:hypothetical protein
MHNLFIESAIVPFVQPVFTFVHILVALSAQNPESQPEVQILLVVELVPKYKLGQF